MSQNECKELKQEHQALLEWKKEKETLINETEAVQKELKDRISNLENSLRSLNEANDELKVRCSGFHVYICNIKTVVKERYVA